MGEAAGNFFRVSTGRQDEANQIPEVLAWNESHDYDVKKTWNLKGKSASKGQQQKALDEIIEYFVKGIIKVLVVWKDDRLERRGSFEFYDFIGKVMKAGGRVEFTTQPALNDLSTMSGRIALTVNAELAAEESKTKKDRKRISDATIDANGGFRWRVPFGYEIYGEKKHKKIRPTAEGKKLIPEIFQRCIDGESFNDIAVWLTSVTDRKWWARSVSLVIRNPAYIGHGVDSKKNIIYTCPPVIDAAMFAKAEKSIASREQRGPTKSVLDPALLKGVILCPNCGGDASMNRIGGGTRRKDGTKPNYLYYYCAGKRPHRKSCGNMVKLEIADKLFNKIMSWMDEDIYEFKLVPGNNHEAEIEELQFQLDHLSSRKLSRDEIRAEQERLWAEQDRLAALPKTDDTYEKVSTGITFAKNWENLDEPGRRAWLVKSGIKVFASKNLNAVTAAMKASSGMVEDPKPGNIPHFNIANDGDVWMGVATGNESMFRKRA